MAEENEKLVKNFIEVSKNPLSYLSRYIAPQLVGSEWYWIRRALLLIMVTQNDLSSRIRLNALLSGPPGCFVEGTLVSMHDGTVKPIEEFGEFHLQNIEQSVRKIQKNSKDHWWTKATQFHEYHDVPCFEITTNKGRKIECSYIQPFWVGDKERPCNDGGEWVKANELKIGDLIQVKTNISNWKKGYLSIKPKSLYSDKREIKEFKLDEKLASLFGYAFGDGFYHKHNGKPYEFGFIVNEEERDLIPLIKSLCEEKLDYSPSINYRKFNDTIIENRHVKREQEMCYITISNLGLSSLFYFLSDKCKNRKIPIEILKSKKSVVSNFLKWYFEADGCCVKRDKKSVGLKSSSPIVLQQIQLLLLGYGIQAHVNKNNLNITGDDVNRFAKHIGFVSKKKKKLLKKSLTLRTVHRIKKKRMFESIINIKYVGKKTVYDITTDSHEFIANGFKVHNTGKTEFLLWVRENLEGVLINAELTSKVGLVGDARGNEITPGFLNQCDGNIVLIDELDKMNSKDQNGLLQAMEEGSYSIIKGAFRERFKAEVRVIASTNSLNKIQKPLLDRFDFIFYVGTSSRKERASNVKRLVNSFMNEKKKPYTKTLKEYLKWVNRYETKMVTNQKDAIEKIIEDYILKTKTDIKYISYRSLELSVLRIAYAMARLERKNMNVNHVENAIWIKNNIIKSVVIQ